MNFNRTKIVKNDTDKFINVPINMQWDFMGRDDGITEYEKDIVSQVIGNPQDFEIIRFAHNVFSNQDSHINYTFNFNLIYYFVFLFMKKNFLIFQ